MMTDPDRIETEDRVYHPGLFAAFPRRRRTVRVTDPDGVQRVVTETAPDQRVVRERVVDPRAARQAYERGRRDERARRHGSPLLGFVVLLIAVAGGAMVYLAAREGSFSGGGKVVDNALSEASQPARNAAHNAGDALENAGRSLKQTGGSSS